MLHTWREWPPGVVLPPSTTPQPPPLPPQSPSPPTAWLIPPRPPKAKPAPLQSQLRLLLRRATSVKLHGQATGPLCPERVESTFYTEIVDTNNNQKGAGFLGLCPVDSPSSRETQARNIKTETQVPRPHGLGMRFSTKKIRKRKFQIPSRHRRNQGK